MQILELKIKEILFEDGNTLEQIQVLTKQRSGVQAAQENKIIVVRDLREEVDMMDVIKIIKQEQEQRFMLWVIEKSELKIEEKMKRVSSFITIVKCKEKGDEEREISYILKEEILKIMNLEKVQQRIPEIKKYLIQSHKFVNFKTQSVRCSVKDIQNFAIVLNKQIQIFDSFYMTQKNDTTLAIYLSLLHVYSHKLNTLSDSKAYRKYLHTLIDYSFFVQRYTYFLQKEYSLLNWHLPSNQFWLSDSLVQSIFTMKILLETNQSFVLTGPPGTGKSSLIAMLKSQVDNKLFSFIMNNCCCCSLSDISTIFMNAAEQTTMTTVVVLDQLSNLSKDVTKAILCNKELRVLFIAVTSDSEDAEWIQFARKLRPSMSVVMVNGYKKNELQKITDSMIGKVEINTETLVQICYEMIKEEKVINYHDYFRLVRQMSQMKSEQVQDKHEISRLIHMNLQPSITDDHYDLLNLSMPADFQLSTLISQPVSIFILYDSLPDLLSELKKAYNGTLSFLPSKDNHHLQILQNTPNTRNIQLNNQKAIYLISNKAQMWQIQSPKYHYQAPQIRVSQQERRSLLNLELSLSPAKDLRKLAFNTKMLRIQITQRYNDLEEQISCIMKFMTIKDLFVFRAQLPPMTQKINVAINLKERQELSEALQAFGQRNLIIYTFSKYAEINEYVKDRVLDLELERDLESIEEEIRCFQINHHTQTMFLYAGPQCSDIRVHAAQHLITQNSGKRFVIIINIEKGYKTVNLETEWEQITLDYVDGGKKQYKFTVADVLNKIENPIELLSMGSSIIQVFDILEEQIMEGSNLFRKLSKSNNLANVKEIFKVPEFQGILGNLMSIQLQSSKQEIKANYIFNLLKNTNNMSFLKLVTTKLLYPILATHFPHVFSYLSDQGFTTLSPKQDMQTISKFLPFAPSLYPIYLEYCKQQKEPYLQSFTHPYFNIMLYMLNQFYEKFDIMKRKGSSDQITNLQQVYTQSKLLLEEECAQNIPDLDTQVQEMINQQSFIMDQIEYSQRFREDLTNWVAQQNPRSDKRDLIYEKIFSIIIRPKATNIEMFTIVKHYSRIVGPAFRLVSDYIAGKDIEILFKKIKAQVERGRQYIKLSSFVEALIEAIFQLLYPSENYINEYQQWSLIIDKILDQIQDFIDNLHQQKNQKQKHVETLVFMKALFSFLFSYSKIQEIAKNNIFIKFSESFASIWDSQPGKVVELIHDFAFKIRDKSNLNDDQFKHSVNHLTVHYLSSCGCSGYSEIEHVLQLIQNQKQKKLTSQQSFQEFGFSVIQQAIILSDSLTFFDAFIAFDVNSPDQKQDAKLFSKYPLLKIINDFLEGEVLVPKIKPLDYQDLELAKPQSFNDWVYSFILGFQNLFQKNLQTLLTARQQADPLNLARDIILSRNLNMTYYKLSLVLALAYFRAHAFTVYTDYVFQLQDLLRNDPIYAAKYETTEKEKYLLFDDLNNKYYQENIDRVSFALNIPMMNEEQQQQLLNEIQKQFERDAIAARERLATKKKKAKKGKRRVNSQIDEGDEQYN